MKQFIFCAGMPRSGSTLLLNILGQNPNIRVGSTSGIMDVLFGVRNQWDQLIEFKASPNAEGKTRVLKGILESYYEDSEHPVVVDKCRGWLTNTLETYEEVFQCKAKVLVPVRDLREILSSFEKLHRKNSLSQSQTERDNYFAFQTVQGRCATWMHGTQPIGLAYNRVNDALQRGLRDRLHFVDFKNLTHHPKSTLLDIYEFLQIEDYHHDFNNIEQLTQEDDSIHGFKNLHTIRNKVEIIQPDYDKVLGQVSEIYKPPYIWEQYKK